MDIDAYTDGLIMVLEKAGVPSSEYEGDNHNNIYELASHLHHKGISFTRACREICKRFNIKVTR